MMVDFVRSSNIRPSEIVPSRPGGRRPGNTHCIHTYKVTIWRSSKFLLKSANRNSNSWHQSFHDIESQPQNVNKVHTYVSITMYFTSWHLVMTVLDLLPQNQNCKWLMMLELGNEQHGGCSEGGDPPPSTTHSSLLFYKATLTNLYGDSSKHLHGGSTTGACTLLLLLHWLGL